MDQIYFLLLGLSREMIDIPDFRHRAGGGRGARVGSKPFLKLIGEISKYCSQTVLGDVTILSQSNLVMKFILRVPIVTLRWL